MNIYLRKEWTNDAQTLKQPDSLSPRQKDVVAYQDSGCTIVKGRWPWYYESKPDKRFKRVNLNCVSYNIVWVE